MSQFFGISGKERRRSRDDVGVSSSNSKSSSKPSHSVNGSSGGGTTYAATSTNSASYGAHHTSQYQQYGSRYSGASAPPPSTASYPASGYSQYGSSYYQVWTQTQFFSICLSPTDCVCIYGIKSTESENFSTYLKFFLTSTVPAGFCDPPPSEGLRSLNPARPLKQESGYSDQVVAKARVWV